MATRAIWDMNRVYEVFLTRAEPLSIGLSSVGARLRPLTLAEDLGLNYQVDSSLDPTSEEPATEPHSGKLHVLAPIAPGVVPRVSIAGWRIMGLGERIPVERRWCTVALDGERAFGITPEEQLEIVLERNGPPVVQIDAALRLASELGVFNS